MNQGQESHGTLAERLNFIGLDAEARESLKALRPLVTNAMGPALAAFYEKVKATPQTRAFFKDDARIAGAKSSQAKHWSLISAAAFDDDYVAAVRAIGQTHARIGLEPRWYIGGYAVVIEQLIDAIVKDRWPHFMQIKKTTPEEMSKSLTSLVKAACLDMDFAISIYLEALEERRDKAEKAQAIVQKEGDTAKDLIAVGLAQMAAKNLTYRMPSDIPESYRKMQTDFNSAMEQLEAAMQSVTASANAIHTGASEISDASDNLSRRTEQQAASLEETAAALVEITANVNKSADGSTNASRVVVTADEDARSSAIVVRRAVDAMQAISQSSAKIGQIIGVIDEIAFQTNLLALNAGVEAARAGDAGRGFAVVASEVRALAKRSAEAAKEIKELITESSRQVAIGVDLVDETGVVLDRIVGQVSEINKIVTNIASGAKDQASGIAEVNIAISQMDQVTQQNAAMAEQATAASHSLSQETEQLNALIGQFQLSSNEPSFEVDESGRLRKRSSSVRDEKTLVSRKGKDRGSRASASEPVERPLRVANGDWTEF